MTDRVPDRVLDSEKSTLDSQERRLIASDSALSTVQSLQTSKRPRVVAEYWSLLFKSVSLAFNVNLIKGSDSLKNPHPTRRSLIDI